MPKQTEQDEVLSVLRDLLSNESETVCVRVSASARRGLSRLKAAIEDADLESVVRSSKSEDLGQPPQELEPEEVRYWSLYRESFTVEHLQAPDNQRRMMSARSAGRFRGAVTRHVLAARFLGHFRPDSFPELDKELEKILSWDDFDVNRVAQLTDRQPLLLVGFAALTNFNLLANLNIQPACAATFIKAVEHHYMPNAYHNSTHAADVTQALLCILHQDSLETKFTDLELFAMILSAILHDVAHPGFSNTFLSRTQDEQALMYNDQSSNEALSLSIGFKILQAPECNLFSNMSREDYFYVRRLITEIILGTDMAEHSKMLAQARVDLHAAGFWEGSDAEGRLLAMKAVIHTADISNVCRPPRMAGMWTRAVYDEFFKQGDAEKEMGIEVSPLCDRDTVAIAESQRVFLSFVVGPTWDLLKEIAPNSYATAQKHLNHNLKLWTDIADQNNPTAVLKDPNGPSQVLHVCPISSPFHNPERHSWGNADMLLLLLNDEENSIIGQGIAIISQREGGVSEVPPGQQ